MNTNGVSSITVGFWGVVVLAVGMLAGVYLIGSPTDQDSLGSISDDQGYNATSTAGNVVFGATITGDKLVKTGYGQLGSVVVTGANTGIVNFYNATTSNVLARTGNPATSTILLASLPASAAAATYTFDVSFTTGLLVELEAGTMPTTTITYR